MSDAVRFVGRVGEMIEQPKKRKWENGGGWFTTRRWLGPVEMALPFANGLTTDGAQNITVSSEDGPIGEVVADYPDGEDPTLDGEQGVVNVTWELSALSNEKSLRTHTTLEPANDAERADLNLAEQAFLSGLPKNSSWGTKAKKLFDHLSKGTSAYSAHYWLLRKTTKCSRESGVTAALSGIDRVGDPSGAPDALFDIPTGVGDGDSIEWKKSPPSVTYLGRGKFSITEEWIGAREWSSDLYGGSAEP